MKKKFNIRDLLFKVLWTGVASGLGLLAAELANVEGPWVASAIMLINAALILARQQIAKE